MPKAIYYRDQARKVREQASAIKDQYIKERMESIARQYDDLANDVERQERGNRLKISN
jgi:hypothetical protein